MWKKKLKHRKWQYFLIGLTLMVTTTIFTMCLDFALELSSFAQNALTKENSADIYLISMGSDELKSNLNSTVSNNVKEMSALTGKSITFPVKYGDKNISQYNQLVLTSEQTGSRNLFSSVETLNDSKQIIKGEVWIANTLAVPNRIKLGDTIILENTNPVKLTVSGIYSSVFSTTPALCFAPIIVSSEDISLFNNNPPGAVFAVDLYDSNTEKLEEIAANNSYISLALSRDVLRSSISEVSSVVSIIGAIASLIIFALALSIISFIIKKSLEKEYKAIGVYKSLGYCANHIRGFYTKGYLVVGVVSIAIGTLLSLPFAYLLGRLSTEYVHGFTLTPLSVVICFLVTGVFMLFLYLNLRKALKRVKKITPVEAIQSGNMRSEKKIAAPIIKNAKSPFCVAVNEMYKRKKTTIMTVLVLLISTYLSMMFVNIGYSSYMMTENTNLWFAVPQNNTYVSGVITEDVANWIKDHESVSQNIYGDLFFSVELSSEEYTNELEDVSFDLFSDTDSELTGVKITGKNPKEVNEIAVTSALLNKIGKKVGDTIHLTINDKAKTYSIVGSYNSMLNNFGIMMTTKGFQKVNHMYTPSRCFVTLDNLDNYDKFKKEAEAKFDSIAVDMDWSAIENSISSTRSMLISVSSILMVVFLLFVAFNIVIVLLMDISDSRRENGILKALGFTNRYLIIKNMAKYVGMVIVSIVIALIVHLSFTSDLLGNALIDAFQDSSLLLSCLSMGIIIIVALTAFIISRSIRNISPIELMEE